MVFLYLYLDYREFLEGKNSLLKEYIVILVAYGGIKCMLYHGILLY